MEKGLNAFELKLIAVAAMVINHFTHILLLLPIDRGVMNVLLTVMNAVGKLTIPIMCFFVAEGYYHTHDLKKYLARMFIFAAISQAPFYLFEHGIPTSTADLMSHITHFNVIFSLAMGLLALTVWKSDKISHVPKILLAAVIALMTRTSDWRIFAVLWIIVFAEFRGDFKKQAIVFTAVAAVRVCYYYVFAVFPPVDIKTVITQSCTVLALIPLYFYNGCRGPKTKYGFYIFYPAHLLMFAVVILLIKGA